MASGDVNVCAFGDALLCCRESDTAAYPLKIPQAASVDDIGVIFYVWPLGFLRRALR